jgi:hypothetical protein
VKKVLYLVVGVLFLLGFSASAGANLITNGDFETNDSLQGWHVNNSAYVYAETGGGGNTWARLDVPNDTTGWAILTQDFYLDPNLAGISIDFDVYFRTGTTNDYDTFKQTVGLDLVGQDPYRRTWEYKFETDQPSDGWQHFQVIVPLDGYNIEDISPFDAQLVFSLQEFNNDWSSVMLDNVDVNPVPEPATILLLGMGLIGMVGYGRKRFIKKS